MVCIRVSSSCSTPGPVRAGTRCRCAARPAQGPCLAAASTSSLTIRPSGPLALRPARLTPISAASRAAIGDALIRAPSPASVLAAAGRTGSRSSGGSSVGPATSPSAAGATACSSAFASAFAGAGASPALPMLAITAPTGIALPASTTMLSTPSASASSSKLALSDSTSASTSPFLTGSPVFFFHSMTVPSSMVSESFGMLTSDISVPSLADHLEGFSDDVVAGRDRQLLELLVVGHGHLGAADPLDRAVEVVEGAQLDAGGDLG